MSFEAFMGSVPGPYHKQNHLPNQDAVVFHEEAGVIYAAVADGAGSLKRSHEGAQLAAETAVYSMVESRKNLDLSKLVEYGLEVARDKLRSRDDYKELGCTLTLAVLTKDGECTAAAIGDSFLVIHEEEKHVLLSGTPLGEYANITELITSEKVNPRFYHGENVRGASLSSDGLESVALAGGEAHPGFWEGILKQAKEGRLDVDKLFRWLDSMDKLVDDSTLLTIIRR